MSNKSTLSFKGWFAIVFWTLYALGVLSLIIIFRAINHGKIGHMPPIEQLQNPKDRYASTIYSADMTVLGQYYKEENRVAADFMEVSPFIIDALIATEDVRYKEHSGVDAKALLRAVVKMGKNGGGSTITQQLAKQQWTEKGKRGWQRALQKPSEWVIATKLEKIYSKDEIITMYLNHLDFNNNAVGIRSACKVYFNKSPKDLTIEQAAMLVGMCKSPSEFNPIRFADRCKERRNVVLGQMCKYGYIAQEECDSLVQLDLGLDFQKVDHKLGAAPYLREHLRLMLTAKKPERKRYSQYHEYVMDSLQWENNPVYGFCNKNFKADGTPYDLYRDGLRIYTTIDSRMQGYAEQAVLEHMTELQRLFEGERKNNRNFPYSNNESSEMSAKNFTAYIKAQPHKSDRYRALKKSGMSEQEMEEIMARPVPMHVFSYNAGNGKAGMKDTIMSPNDSVHYYNSLLRCGFTAIDPRNGYVKAYVGGPDFRISQFDCVYRGQRQVGSTIKPYLYTIAMDEGMCPNTTIINDSVTLLDGNNNPWTPKAGHADFRGEPKTLADALKESSNWITVYLMREFGVNKMIQMLRSFGIHSKIDPQVSLCLGAVDLSVIEMIDAYTTFPNKGVRMDPLLITRIENNEGNVIAQFEAQSQEVISEETSYKMLQALQGVCGPGGTGYRMRFKYGKDSNGKLTKPTGVMPIGGKTGTTNNNTDGWFIGFTPSLVAGAWVGGFESHVRFRSMSNGQGAASALPIVALFLNQVYEDDHLGYDVTEQFDIPEWYDPNQQCE